MALLRPWLFSRIPDRIRLSAFLPSSHHPTTSTPILQPPPPANPRPRAGVRKVVLVGSMGGTQKDNFLNTMVR